MEASLVFTSMIMGKGSHHQSEREACSADTYLIGATSFEFFFIPDGEVCMYSSIASSFRAKTAKANVHDVGRF